MMHKIMKKETGGYLTAEAALLLPFIIGLVLLVLMMSFHIYNRCVFDQTGIVLLIRAVSTKPEEVKKLQEYEKVSRKQFFLLRKAESQITPDKNEIRISRRYTFENWSGPIRSLSDQSGQMSILEQEMKVSEYRPVHTIRQVRRLYKVKDAIGKMKKDKENDR